ncbi:ABC transporter permease [Sinorhizobium meliloti]|uniref:ABC transporter permease n=1 Tax=Rhizobium meliloti TaxID=382 RepID=UPI0002861A6C|nr:ABC transporter permease [Sinorhizobium meliloti]ASP80082.1 ABC transporter permease [Sinorhizobium meliloti]KKA12841.1 ABC transporter permease [Sinorhizobium meliloti]MDE3799863.1 ABC transporter permease [Sinorhizobium meliloti]MQW15768.1 ABC transporter permease [Sinorhizobium meliloti]RMI15841.1 ABC transporter permease [Sinorhizobium meliloti]
MAEFALSARRYFDMTKLQSWTLPAAVIAVFIGFSVVEPRVFSQANIFNIVTQTSYLAIFAMAQTVVIVTRGFDLSLGFTVSLVSVISAMVMVAAGEPPVAIGAGILAGLAVAAVIGATNGVLIAGVGINPLVTTLGVANIVLSLASTVSDGFPVSGFPVQFSEFFAQGSVLGLPVPVVVAGLLFAALSVLMNWTRFGRSLYIIGANPKAAVAAGIRSGPIVAAAYCLCGTLIGLGALMLTARTGSGEPNLGGNLTLESIAAAVVGGVKLSGGEGGVGAALLGALFVTVLSNGMNLTQVDGYLQQICLGAIIIIALVTSRGHSRH